MQKVTEILSIYASPIGQGQIEGEGEDDGGATAGGLRTFSGHALHDQLGMKKYTSQTSMGEDRPEMMFHEVQQALSELVSVLLSALVPAIHSDYITLNCLKEFILPMLESLQAFMVCSPFPLYILSQTNTLFIPFSIPNPKQIIKIVTLTITITVTIDFCCNCNFYYWVYLVYYYSRLKKELSREALLPSITH